MGKLTVKEILKATGGRIISGSPDAAFTGVSIDSRTIRNDELFVPLKGQRFDGHDFLMAALKSGSGALVTSPVIEPVMGRTIIAVEDTLKALQDMAHYARMKSGATVIGVTGTNGKTTTKELIASILGVRHRVMKTTGNLNNHIGLPLCLVTIGVREEFAVLEMGASMKGDIKQLCDIAVPDIGVITNVGLGHLEGFGSLEVVRSTKLELADAVKTIVVNAEDAFLMEGISEKRMTPAKAPDIITFGISDKADIFARDIVFEEAHSVFTLCIGDKRSSEVRLHVPGRFNISNALAAASLCNALGLELMDIKKGLEAFAGVPMRLELKDYLGATVISDVYNANPLSMEEAIKELVRLRKGRAIVVLGDMLELGAYAEEAHRRLGRWMAGLPVDIFIAVGLLMSKAAEEFSLARKEGYAPAGSFSGESRWREQHGFAPVLAVADSSDARKVLLDIWKEGDTILVKGSRGTHMERVLGGHPEKPLIPAGSEAGNAL
ncbi:MAG TPA: UDP-N-acetylmuramoyl-tripeptide--D-alanyl-D-alanine ligase [Nitrospiraceae bacterium]|jgi:UDP-N-acetylmuramoyl-tripeptide--D-alanyl-D-alanine ligase|nr:UDP-N-acetylmuramoyl-tripeptide--D-alanyl-D-alanine ligase [Nitrospiraceae bacterium]